MFIGCPEDNIWIVFDRYVEFNTASIAFRNWMYISQGKEIQLKRNTRHVQSLNDRPVYGGLRERITLVNNVQSTNQINREVEESYLIV